MLQRIAKLVAWAMVEATSLWHKPRLQFSFVSVISEDPVPQLRSRREVWDLERLYRIVPVFLFSLACFFFLSLCSVDAMIRMPGLETNFDYTATLMISRPWKIMAYSLLSVLFWRAVRPLAELDCLGMEGIGR